MMRIVFLSLLLLGVILGDAIGACPGSRIGNQPDELNTFISDTLVCGTAISGNDKWQEEHRSSGVLWERAQGPGDPVDPSHQIGTWDIENRGVGNQTDDWVCYNYSGGSRYCFQLKNQAGTTFFCDVSDNRVATAVIHSISGVCSF